MQVALLRMINNWEYTQLNMDFSSMFPDNDHPSDIDMFYLCRDNTLILGEIKSARGKFGDGQKRLLKRILDAHSGDGVGLYITHNKLTQNGDKVVDVSVCPVEQIYIKGEYEWRKPKSPAQVKDILRWYRERAEGRF